MCGEGLFAMWTLRQFHGVFFFHRYSKQTLQFLTTLIRSVQECDK